MRRTLTPSPLAVFLNGTPFAVWSPPPPDENSARSTTSSSPLWLGSPNGGAGLIMSPKQLTASPRGGEGGSLSPTSLPILSGFPSPAGLPSPTGTPSGLPSPNGLPSPKTPQSPGSGKTMSSPEALRRYLDGYTAISPPSQRNYSWSPHQISSPRQYSSVIQTTNGSPRSPVQLNSPLRRSTLDYLSYTQAPTVVVHNSPRINDTTSNIIFTSSLRMGGYSTRFDMTPPMRVEAPEFITNRSIIKPERRNYTPKEFLKYAKSAIHKAKTTGCRPSIQLGKAFHSGLEMKSKVF